MGTGGWLLGILVLMMALIVIITGIVHFLMIGQTFQALLLVPILFIELIIFYLLLLQVQNN